jgi:hypothetical protein
MARLLILQVSIQVYIQSKLLYKLHRVISRDLNRNTCSAKGQRMKTLPVTTISAYLSLLKYSATLGLASTASTSFLSVGASFSSSSVMGPPSSRSS